jgi:O-antigen/teichoic acid export membrane protein
MIKISKKDIIWSYFGFFINIANGLIILPFLLYYLSPKEIGLWYTFMSISAFVMLLDFGFSPTLSRNVSYVWGGAKELNKIGNGDEDIQFKEPNYKLLFNVFKVTKKIYLVISLLTLLILLTIGTYYVISITNEIEGNNHIIAWIVFSFGVFFNMFYSYWTPLLRGIGAIKQGQIANVIARTIQIIITIIGLILSFNLIAVAVAYLISGLVLRFISKMYFLKKINKKSFYKEAIDKNYDQSKLKELFGIMWHNSWRLGLVSFGAFLITNSSTLICSSYLGLDITASYGIALQLFAILTSLSSTLYVIYLPELNIATIYKNPNRVKEIITFSTLVNWGIFIIGSIVIIFFGKLILNILQPSLIILPPRLLVFMAIYLFLENNHSMFATFITIENRIPFMKSAIISGFAIVLLSITLVNYTQLGLFGLLFSQAIVQLAYNNWKWPLEVVNKYNLSNKDVIFYFKNLCDNFFKI